MSSRIDIPSKALHQTSASLSPLSSSSSTYSTSPSTPARSSTSAQKQKMIHERRPSLLGTFAFPNTASLWANPDTADLVTVAKMCHTRLRHLEVRVHRDQHWGAGWPASTGESSRADNLGTLSSSMADTCTSEIDLLPLLQPGLRLEPRALPALLC